MNILKRVNLLIALAAFFVAFAGGSVAYAFASAPELPLACSHSCFNIGPGHFCGYYGEPHCACGGDSGSNGTCQNPVE